MSRLAALRWLSALLMLSGLAGGFPPPARAGVASHVCCRGGRVCRCEARGTDTNFGPAGPHDGCSLSAAGCSPAAAAPAAGSTVLVVLTSGASLVPPARRGVPALGAREHPQSCAFRPASPPPRPLG